MPINDLDKDNWKDYIDMAGSYWSFPNDADTLSGKNKFHGSFVIQVARNLITRYTKKGDWVIDLFGGSGTTYRACVELERSSVLVDLRYKHTDAPKRKVTCNTTGSIHLAVKADSSSKLPFLHPANLVILHPPYHDIIKFSKRQADLSNLGRSDFYAAMSRVFENAASITVKGGFVALVMGDIYKDGELIPASKTADLAEAHGLSLKALYVKNMTGNEVGKGKNTNLWRYRGLVNGFSTFDHEYIYVWAKKS